VGPVPVRRHHGAAGRGRRRRAHPRIVWPTGERRDSGRYQGALAAVHDTGTGPADRLAGLVPVPSSAPDRHLGLGPWVMHQLDIDVTLGHTGDGFTVRLRHLPGPSRPAAPAR
jgi:hypothetical protein